jgi:hypothetical protein
MLEFYSGATRPPGRFSEGFLLRRLHPVITAHSPNQISFMFWGLIPFFAKEKNYPYKFNWSF